MSWTVDRSKILQPDEIHTVLADLRRKARRATNTKMNLTVFRLATCCGLRASEIAGLVLADVQVNSTQPKIRVRREVGKGHKARKVPLTWDEGTLGDLREWKRFRLEQAPRTMTASFARSTVIPSAIRWNAGTFASDSKYAVRASDANAKAN